MLEILLFSLLGLAAAQTQIPTTRTSTVAPPSAFMPVCDPSTNQPSGRPVPDLPDQFSFTIEGNLFERNSTAVMTEYYDGPGNRGRLEFGWNGSSSIGIFDYNLGEIFLMPDFLTGDDCRVYSIADAPPFLNGTFGVVVQNGSLHIGSPRTFIEALRDDTVTRYIGEDMIRGIPTQRWQGCVNRDNISYQIDYYFVAEPWNYEGQGQKLDSTQMVPVQFTLNTTRIANGTVRNIYHIYTVVDFRAGPDSVPDSLFRVPNGLACTGRFPGQPVPQVPPFFSTYVERVFRGMGGNSIQTSREFYDIQNSLYRIDVYNSGRGPRGGGTPGPISIIHDFSTSVQYLVGTQVLNCTATPLSDFAPYFFDITSDDSETLQLVSPNNFFFLGNEFNYSYEGVSNIRGVDVDSWVSVRDFEKVAGAINLTDAIYEVFFTRPDWIYATDRSINTAPAPWRINISGSLSIRNSSDNSTFNVNGTFQLDFFDFSMNEPNYDSFDISLCSAPEEYHTVLMLIPGQEKGLDFGRLRRNIRASVSNYTGVKPLQIGNIQIVRENGTHIYVTFHISNLTDLARKKVPNPVTSQMAVQLLTNNSVSGATLPFKIEIAENVSVSPILRQVGIGRRNFNASCNDNNNSTNNGTDKCKDNITNRLGLNDNVVAGIAVGLFVVGLILGVIFVLACICCVYCCRSSSYDIQRSKPVRYEKQKDEILT